MERRQHGSMHACSSNVAAKQDDARLELTCTEAPAPARPAGPAFCGDRRRCREGEKRGVWLAPRDGRAGCCPTEHTEAAPPPLAHSPHADARAAGADAARELQPQAVVRVPRLEGLSVAVQLHAPAVQREETHGRVADGEGAERARAPRCAASQRRWQCPPGPSSCMHACHIRAFMHLSDPPLT